MRNEIDLDTDTRKAFLSRWVSICLLNLFLVAFLGLLLRYKIGYSLPQLDQKFLLHSHSHFAFSGWITQCLMVLMVFYLARKMGEVLLLRYRKILYAQLFVSYGMMISFLIQGYAFFSISFSTLSILVFAWFSLMFWKDLGRVGTTGTAPLWFKASLFFGLISSLGVASLAWVMANKITDQQIYLSSVYFFLHFQYNGWFLLAGLGLLSDTLEEYGANKILLRRAFLLFSGACAPAYMLSILWFSFPVPVYILLILVVVAQLYGWFLILKAANPLRNDLRSKLSSIGRWLWILAALAFSIKLILQAGSVHPELSKLSYGFRPIIIGYLHLVLLGVTSLFLLGFILSHRLVELNKRMMIGAIIFAAGVILNELFLMWQGVAALSYVSVPGINVYLFFAALTLVLGSAMMAVSGKFR